MVLVALLWCRAAVQIVEWIELERENLVRQLHLLRSVFIKTYGAATTDNQVPLNRATFNRA